MKIGILTDFISHDPAYSLCGVVLNQLKMLRMPMIELEVVVFVRADPTVFVADYGDLADRIVQLDPGKTGSNVVTVDEDSEREISELYEQYVQHFGDLDVMLTHDLIYQANMWKYHVAARRYAQVRPELRWIHWVHSSTDWRIKEKTGRYQNELDPKWPGARLVAFHPEEINRKGTMYGYERDEIHMIPNPLHLEAYYHPAARLILEAQDYWTTDILAVYPARLDRGKQIEVIGDVFRELRRMKWDARVIVVDFHSTGGDKVSYRDYMKEQYGDFMAFTSDHEGLEYHIPHEAVINLFDYSDVFIHPSRSEADPLTIPEAAWAANLLVLNFDLPLMRLWEEFAVGGRFSSNIDVTTGMPGSTETEYGNRRDYMRGIAEAIVYHCANNPVLSQHRIIRKRRSLDAVFWRDFWPVVSGGR